MLIAKLKEPLSKIYQGTGITTITVSCEYMSVSVENYQMSQEHYNFYYKIGKMKFDEENNPLHFEPIIRGYIFLSALEIADWGTDDYVAIKCVADKLGIVLDESVQINAPSIMFKS